MNRCPDCNSADADLVDARRILGRDMQALRCNRCGRRWRRFVVAERYSFPSDCPCPTCAARGRVLSTQGAIRYLACSAPGCPVRWKVLGEKV